MSSLVCVVSSQFRIIVRRKLQSRGELEDLELPTDLESTQEDPSKDKQKAEVVEPQQEPDPPARDEFHQAYVKKLEVADKAVEEYTRSLDSVSYPVSARTPLSQQQTPHTNSSLLGLVIFGQRPPSHRLRIRTLFNKCVPLRSLT